MHEKALHNEVHEGRDEAVALARFVKVSAADRFNLCSLSSKAHLAFQKSDNTPDFCGFRL